MPMEIRQRTTEQIIRSAFRDLVREGHKNINVKKICDAAAISRATFYAHYRDLYDLIATDEREALSRLGFEDYAENYTDPKARAGIFLRVLTHLDENEWLYRYYFGVQGNWYFSLVLQDIMAAVSAELVRRGVFSEQEKADLSVLYHTTGLMAALRRWLEYGRAKPCTREAYAQMLSEIA